VSVHAGPEATVPGAFDPVVAELSRTPFGKVNVGGELELICANEEGNDRFEAK